MEMETEGEGVKWINPGRIAFAALGTTANQDGVASRCAVNMETIKCSETTAVEGNLLMASSWSMVRNHGARAVLVVMEEEAREYMAEKAAAGQ